MLLKFQGESTKVVRGSLQALSEGVSKITAGSIIYDSSKLTVFQE